MRLFQRVSEGLARKTSRRGFFGRSAGIAMGALMGTAAGSIARPEPIGATHVYNTFCAFPGNGCPCDGCSAGGVCKKPCIIMTVYWASGCWVTAGETCCDCDCNGNLNFPASIGGGPAHVCGCGSDYHTDPHNCV
jgi:hypothetical protein